MSVLRILGTLSLLFLTSFSPSALAQSLDPNRPAPLKAGINSSTVDNMVGAQYWYYLAGPGEVKVVISYRSAGVLGAAMRSAITVSLYDEKKTWIEKRTISSEKALSETSLNGKFDKQTKTVICVAPPPSGLVRSGGDYDIEVTGAVQFSSDPDDGQERLVTRTDTGSHGATKFLPDGHVQTADGTEGRWKLFNRDSRIYTIVYPNYAPESVRYMPARGLVNASDQSVLLYTEVRK
jgi:hypothetical protein